MTCHCDVSDSWGCGWDCRTRQASKRAASIPSQYVPWLAPRHHLPAPRPSKCKQALFGCNCHACHLMCLQDCTRPLMLQGEPRRWLRMWKVSWMRGLPYGSPKQGSCRMVCMSPGAEAPGCSGTASLQAAYAAARMLIPMNFQHVTDSFCSQEPCSWRWPLLYVIASISVGAPLYLHVVGG